MHDGRRCRGNITGRLHAQGLANADIVIGQTVPGTQIILSDVVAFGNIIDGIAAHDFVRRGINVYRRI